VAQRSKILIVDDEPLNVDYLEQELEDSGYDTISATNGQEALDKVRAEPPDLILLDVMMPVMDGISVCRALKGNEDTRLIPIVIMTALDGIEDRIQGIEAGADDFLTKPVNDRELLARIQTTLKLKHTVDRKIGELRRIKDHLAHFVPEAVRQMVTAGADAVALEKQQRDISALFVDISGYTQLSEQLPVEIVNALVERYFSAFLDLISDAGGDIHETAGDGFVAIFYGEETQTHPIRSVEAALALLNTTRMLAKENIDSPLAIHMGMSSGIALVGAARFEGLRRSRWVFSATGSVINLAARLAAVAQPGQIIVCPEAARRLGQRFQLQNLGSELLKNIAQPVDIHLILERH
jgi:adenylate cyclase